MKFPKDYKIKKDYSECGYDFDIRETYKIKTPTKHRYFLEIETYNGDSKRIHLYKAKKGFNKDDMKQINKIGYYSKKKDILLYIEKKEKKYNKKISKELNKEIEAIKEEQNQEIDLDI